jgi:hypothetical protein
MMPLFKTSSPGNGKSWEGKTNFIKRGDKIYGRNFLILRRVKC